MEIIEFSKKGCPPCTAQNPEMRKFKKENPNVKVKNIDVDKHERVADDYEIESVPTFIFERNGRRKKVVGGPISSGDLKRILVSI